MTADELAAIDDFQFATGWRNVRTVVLAGPLAWTALEVAGMLLLASSDISKSVTWLFAVLLKAVTGGTVS